MFTSLGLMSGTSGDGIDASLIISNGIDKFEEIKNKYFEYDSDTYEKIHSIKDKIFKINDLEKFSSKLRDLEREITLHHAKIIKEFNFNSENAVIGFHGQTIYHNPKEKKSIQLGNGKLLSQLSSKKVVFDFRKNDIVNEGQGAPLTPIFHHLLSVQNEFKLPVKPKEENSFCYVDTAWQRDYCDVTLCELNL